MRSSLGAPHSTERCKITKNLQRGQIFLTFCMCNSALFWDFKALVRYNLSSNPSFGVETVLQLAQLELQYIV